MPNRGDRTRPGGPKSYLRSGKWPDGKKLVESPTAVFWAAEISRRLAVGLAGRSKTATAEEAGLYRSTLYDLLNGSTWPDLVTISVLEEVLEVELWPRWGVGEISGD